MRSFIVDQTTVRRAAETLRFYCHGVAASSGWWTERGTGRNLTASYDPSQPYDGRNIGELLCLVHSEISEAMEGARKGLMDDHLPDRYMLEVELADAVIRIMDMAGGLGLDVPGAIAEKLAYNQSRADHKPEARAAAGGKAF